ncbi:hypothetical protein GWK08_04335 [Leptobacterium flavescens]|uniref:Redoxin domain-containing protein n=1 Tax=Leptobacterium flavescens TaxID=472055 RepID=A0A6P0UI39_9FLAO|nr:hypothetical protein [Leptobacterium flavescens]NER12657.1 hypothetical protein [Leptobacterium flavescens]
MKKFFVLGVLFILPIVAYLFFASGVNNFAKLPTMTIGVKDVTHFNSLDGENVTLQNKITILGFFGDNVEFKKGNAFNLNQKIYKRFYEFKDFQFVIVLPKGQEEKVKELKAELSNLTDTVNWKFIFGDKEDIETLFNSLGSDYALDEHLSTPRVFIIDKDRNLRGRKGDETLYGFDATSVSEINNKMEDDVKIILAEYRLALKKNNAYREK